MIDEGLADAAAANPFALARLHPGIGFRFGRLIRHARYFTLQLAECNLTGPLFRQILTRIERLAWHPT